MRFFTREGVEALLEESGFRAQHIERTVAPLATPSDLVPDVSLLRLPDELRRRVSEDAESETLQFVVRAVPLPGPAASSNAGASIEVGQPGNRLRRAHRRRSSAAPVRAAAALWVVTPS